MLKKKTQKTILFATSILFALSASAGIGLANGVFASADETDYIEKASIRIGDYQGIRFETVLSSTTYQTAENSAVKKYGTYIIPSAYLGAGEEIDENTTNKNVHVVESVPYESNGAYKYHSVMYDVPVWGYETELTARSFVAYGENEENLAYVWTDTFETSLSQVATDNILDEETKYTKEIMSELVNFVEKAYVYDYANADYATLWQAIGDGEVSVSNGALNATVTANGGVLIPFGSLTDISGLLINGSSDEEVEVIANNVSLGNYLLSETTDLTSAFVNAGVDSLYYLQIVSTGADFALNNVTVKAARPVNVLYNFDDYDSVEGLVTSTGEEVRIAQDSVLNRNALQIDVKASKGDDGNWVAKETNVSFALDTAKTNFAGYTGIRFYVNGSNTKMEVRIGNGATYNSAYFTLNKNNGNYMTIPFSAFEGTTALNQITELAFYVWTGDNNTKVNVADISIGTAACYGVDNRADFMTSAVRVIEDFNSLTNSDVSGSTAKWAVSSGTPSLATVYDGTNGLKIYGTKSVDITAIGYVVKYDLTKTNGFRMDFKPHVLGGVGSANGVVARLTVTLGSKDNYYYMSKDFYRSAWNNTTTMVCDFAGMKLVDGSTGALNLKKMDKIMFTWTVVNTSMTTYDIRFDNLEFYEEKVGAESVAFTSDFSDTTTQNWGTSPTIANNVLTYTKSNTSNYYSFTYRTDNQNTSINCQGAYAIRVRAKITNAQQIHARIYTDYYAGQGIQTAKVDVVNSDEYIDYIIYLWDYTEQKTTIHTSCRLWRLEIFVNCGTQASSIECEKVEILVG